MRDNLLCQKVFLSIALALSSSYSFLDTHILLKVSKAANIDPLHTRTIQSHYMIANMYPIQVEYSLSCGAEICL